jgi:hypothetical protein
MNKEYLQLAFGKGKFYAYSKTEKEGYEPHTNTKGDVTYRKYYDSVRGVFESAGFYDSNFGKQVSLRFKDGETVYIAQFQLFDQKNSIDTYAASLVSTLPNLNKGEEYIMTTFNFIPEGEKYAKIGVSFKSPDGVKVERALSNSYYKNGELVAGDIPALEWVEKRGKKMPSAASVEMRDDYLYGVFEKEVERLGYEASAHQPASHSSEPAPEPAKVSTKVVTPPSVDEDDDELPF